MDSLKTIFDKYDCDKNSYFHNYCRQYEDLFTPSFRQLPIRCLELGVYKGQSLKIWREVFKNAECIVGVDIDQDSKMYESPFENIFIQIGDATSEEFINQINQKFGPFDFIIDDASHRNDHVIKSFELLFPLLKDNGLYIVEDTITYKASNFLNVDYPNHLEYFCKYLPYLNQWRHDSVSGVKDHCVDPFKINKKAENIFEASIDKILFGVSHIAIYKKVRQNWL